MVRGEPSGTTRLMPARSRAWWNVAMSENEQRPPEEPYDSPAPTNPYGQPVSSSPEQSPEQPPAGDPAGRDPYGRPGPQHGYPPPYAPQSSGSDQPSQAYGQPSQPYGQPPQPYGQPPQPYGSHPYGAGTLPRRDARPGTVTAAGWITVVLGVLGVIGWLLFALVLVLARDVIVREMEMDAAFQDLGFSGDSVMGFLVAGLLLFVVWSAINVLLGVFVLRRSNVARILLVISCAGTALLSLALIASGASAVSLIVAIAVIVLLFVGGAGDWFAPRTPSAYGGPPHGGAPYGQDDHPRR